MPEQVDAVQLKATPPEQVALHVAADTGELVREKTTARTARSPAFFISNLLIGDSCFRRARPTRTPARPGEMMAGENRRGYQNFAVARQSPGTCPEELFDCCCGFFQACLYGINAAQECAQACGHWG